MAKNLGHDLQDYGDIECPLPQNTTDKPSRIGHVIEFNKQVRTTNYIAIFFCTGSVFDIHVQYLPFFRLLFCVLLIGSLAVIRSWAYGFRQQHNIV